jgi:hypothetical protein
MKRLNWIDESVAIGNLIEANNVSLLRRENIDMVIDVRTAFNANARFEFLLGRHILNSKRAMRISILLASLFSLKSKVLVHCLEGTDRTPFVVMLYVSEKYGMNHKDAYYFVKQRRPQTRFHWRWVKKYENFLKTSQYQQENENSSRNKSHKKTKYLTQ